MPREAAPSDGADAPALGLPVLDDRAASERLLLRLAVGAAARRLHLSYPRLELGQARPRVPSFYALDLERARTGRVLDFRITEREAFERVQSRLAWPAPKYPDDAIDDMEHDLAVLGPLLRGRAGPEPTGRARYLLDLEPTLGRSLRARWARWRPEWSRFDGVHQPEGPARDALDAQRLTARPYSVTALQRFAACPYQFLLASVFRLQPRDEIGALERIDPLTRGKMFHEAQADVIRRLEADRRLPVTWGGLAEAWAALDETLDALDARYREELAPAIDRVWADEIEKLRIDLKGWLRHVAEEDSAWTPIRAELGFGLPPGRGRDPRGTAAPVLVDGAMRLHGVVDLVEAPAQPTASGELRVTDHKTGRNRTADGMVVGHQEAGGGPAGGDRRNRMVVGHGEVLQPVLYGLAVEQAMGRPVRESRLFFATLAGGFTTLTIRLDETADPAAAPRWQGGEAHLDPVHQRVLVLLRKLLSKTAREIGVEALSIVDRAVKDGVILPAPRCDACKWCDYRVVCGPWEEERARRKDKTKLVDLQVLRRLP